MKIESVGEKLRQLRGDRTMREISDATGIKESALGMYERGERNPRDDVKIRLARFYGVSLSELFYPDEYTNREVG